MVQLEPLCGPSWKLQPHFLTQLADSENDKERAAVTEHLAKDKQRGPLL